MTIANESTCIHVCKLMAGKKKAEVREGKVSTTLSRFRALDVLVDPEGLSAPSLNPKDTSPKPVTPSDLPPEAQRILGLLCQEGDCLADQPICPPDPRITCQLIPADPSLTTWVRDWVRLPWRIGNARKGDLIMSPGGASGVISTLLSRLSPPQHYSHMGIMVRDQVGVRHATACDDWLQDHPNGSIPLDGPEPTDGFQPDALRYGWPGTITQSIEEAYLASLDDTYGPAHRTAADNGKSYSIHALSFEPSVVNAEPDDSKPPRWQTLQCLVVRPCPILETDPIRDALHRISDEVINIRGHYRFFAYSSGAICLDPNFFGPPCLEGEERDPKAPCGPQLPVQKTIPVVCSTLIWAAVERINARGVAPKLVLVGPDHRDEKAGPCKNTLERDVTGDRRDPLLDGLCLYDEPQRREAANALFEYLRETVKRSVAKKIPGIVTGIGGVLIGVGAVIATLSLPVAILAELLGISLNDADKLIEWISELPDDVANQVVNAFASDYCDEDAKDSDRWKSPGPGSSVSPDNIIRSWSAPRSDLGDPREVLVGLYGNNVRAKLRPPKWEIRPLTAWAVSEGPSGMGGVVTFRGKPVNGAGEFQRSCRMS